MKFKSALTEGIFLKRYYQFLVEIVLKNQKNRMIYCPNLGNLTHCDVLGSRIWFSNPLRLSEGYLDIWELVEVNGGWLVCINPSYTAILVQEGIESGVIAELQAFQFLKSPGITNVKDGIQLLLKEDGEQCFIQIETVLLADDKNECYFPSVRGEGFKNLSDLIALKESGHRAVLLYCIQHNGVQVMRPADNIDAEYGKLLREAVAKGVEVLAYKTAIDLNEIKLDAKILVSLSEGASCTR